MAALRPIHGLLLLCRAARCWQPSSHETASCLGANSAQCTLELWSRCLGRPRRHLQSSSSALAGGVEEAGNASLCRAAPCEMAGGERRAWLTMINGNAVNYTTNALVQALAVRMFSCYPHVVQVTPEVSQEVRARLAALGSEVREIPWIRWQNQPKGIIDGYRWLMTKLQAWNVSGYDRVAFIDADLFPTGPAADRLFAQCATDADLCCAVERGNRIMNSGIMVTRPSATRLRQMLTALDGFRKDTAIFPDMAFLSRYYDIDGYVKRAKRVAEPSLRRHLQTPNGSASGLFLFNVDRAGRRMDSPFHNCPDLARTISLKRHVMASSSFWKSVDRVKLWHSCGRHKLETLPLCSNGPQLQASDHQFCAARLLRLYQWLYERANPCVVDGASADRCQARLECRWCSPLVRCIPSGWSCFETDLGTRAFEERMTRPKGQSTIRPGWCNHQCDEACCAAAAARKKRLAAKTVAKKRREEPKQLNNTKPEKDLVSAKPKASASLPRSTPAS